MIPRALKAHWSTAPAWMPLNLLPHTPASCWFRGLRGNLRIPCSGSRADACWRLREMLLHSRAEKVLGRRTPRVLSTAACMVRPPWRDPSECQLLECALRLIDDRWTRWEDLVSCPHIMH